METSRLPCVTTSLVLNELVTLLCRRAGASFGVGGFTDAVSFVLMRQARITRAFGFDRRFTAAGFELWPQP